MTTASKAGIYSDLFHTFEAHAAGGNLAWLRELRREAFARFSEHGFPTTHDEDWRFTSVAAIAGTDFRLARKGEARISPEQLQAWSIPGAVARLVFVNGHYAPDLSDSGPLSAGIEVTSLAEALHSPGSAIEQHFGRYLDLGRDSFCALNTAFAEDGAYVHLLRGAALEVPLHLLYLSSAEAGPVMSHPRNLIVAEAQSQLAVVEEFLTLGGGTAFCNAVTELAAGEQSVISHYRIEREQDAALTLSTLRVEQSRGAAVTSHALLLGGALVRNNVHAVLAGEGGDCLINGLFAGRGAEHLDNYMLVEHASPHCASRQFYNGILDGHARGVYHGRIVVHPDAQKTDAKQTNRNLLLSDDAQIDTKPQLEIHADDVKCTHGATIGQIDEEALFYLRSRGIGEGAARRLLLLAFAGECLERMKEAAVRRHAARLVRQTVRHLTGGHEADSGDDAEEPAEEFAVEGSGTRSL